MPHTAPTIAYIDDEDMLVEDPRAQELDDLYAKKAELSDRLTSMSQVTSKTFMANLQRQLDEER